MLNKDQQRELAYLVVVDEIKPIPNYDRVEHARVGGWWVIVRKDQFKVGDPAIYFEIDSLVPEKEPFMFLEKRHFKVKSIKMCGVYSQGLLMHPDDFGWKLSDLSALCILDDKGKSHFVDDDSRFLTDILGVKYYDPDDQKRKSDPKPKAPEMPKFFRSGVGRKMMRVKWLKKILIALFGKKKKKSLGWPTGRFPGVSKTDQERVENMPYVLSDKTPYIRTQKCDGSSGTFILERKKKNKFEFYVCSRNVRYEKENKYDEKYFDKNYFWEVAIKYDIENKLKDYLNKNPDMWFVCWQGEVCAPNIQGNPQHLTETHLFLFHFTDSKNGRLDIRKAKEIWNSYDMEIVPIDSDLYVLPDDMEEFKITADGLYDPSVCEGSTKCQREGFVYYKSTDPTFSFKNVSRQYLLAKG